MASPATGPGVELERGIVCRWLLTAATTQSPRYFSTLHDATEAVTVKEKNKQNKKMTTEEKRRQYKTNTTNEISIVDDTTEKN